MTPLRNPQALTSARDIAKAWRANPTDRLRIERQIAVEGRSSEFTRNRWGELIARATPEDAERVRNCRKMFGTSADRRFAVEMLDPQIVAVAGMGLTQLVPHGALGFAVVDREDRA